MLIHRENYHNNKRELYVIYAIGNNERLQGNFVSIVPEITQCETSFVTYLHK